MEYNHKEIESRWQNYWRENKVYKTEIDKSRPKFYVLVIIAESMPLISRRFIRCLLKWSPAVGAATAPSSLAKIVW